MYSYPIPYKITKLLVVSQSKRLFHNLGNAEPVRIQLNKIHERFPVDKIKVIYDTVVRVQLQLNGMSVPSTTERKLRI